ncbi:hypothetical protein PNF40_003449 [Cronobacter sakazakii]|uniref:hypothetical protein n=1 Tax=Cronobacter sakazakii TaxID=28141 RepID=UPI0018F89F27|nr:hypothetical protein [Cronobacter sakazakii]EKK3977731.1 hypothetical protein [Cronobacter sakazakii]
MSTISNERLESLQRQFKEEGFNDISDSEIMQLVEENLALRKEREKAGRPQSELSQRAQQILRDATALAEKLSAETDTTSQQFESLAGKVVVTDEKGNLPCPFCGGRCDPNGWMGSYDDGVPMCGPECEDCGATASSIEEWNRRSTALAGKAVVPEGWKLVPIELTKEMLKQIHPFAEATCFDCGNQVVAHCADNVTASWNDMLAVAPEPCK